MTPLQISSAFGCIERVSAAASSALVPDLQPIFIAVPRRHQPLHDASLLIHLHREHAAVARAVVVFGDGVAEGLVHLLDLGIEDLGKPEAGTAA